MTVAVHLESPLPPVLPAGSSTALFCSGTACEPSELELVVDGRTHPVPAFAMPRFDVPCRRSGFWGVVPVDAPERGSRLELQADFRGAGGNVERVPLGAIAIVAQQPVAPPSSPAADQLIAICMATFDPDPELFRIQVESLRAQSDRDWICIVSDDCSSEERYREMLSVLDEDSRFVVSRNERRVGFYRNFERSLTMVPPQAALVALCDQDDAWHPDKLEVLRASLGPAMLVYSDQRLVDPHRRVLRETLWRGRKNNFTNIGSLLIANTVTGAASLFRRELLADALPFPDSPGNDFHDHWIALVALASGSLSYVDRALYDYIQHPRAVLGYSRHPARERSADQRRHLVPRPKLRRWRAAYFHGYVPGEVRARTLLLRCGDRMSPAKRHALERYVAVPSSVAALVWLLVRPVRMLAGRTETLGSEWHVAYGIVWFHLARFIARRRRWSDRWMLDTRIPEPDEFEQKRLRRWRERV